MAYGTRRSYSRKTKASGRSMLSSMRNQSRTRYKRYGTISSYRKIKRFTPRFATVGFNRDVEKKYLDRTMALVYTTTDVSGAILPTGTGQMWYSVQNTPVNFESTPGSGQAGSQIFGDVLKGLQTGTTVSSRIGNKIRVRYIKGAITFTAATIANSATTFTNAQYGEAAVTNSDNNTVYQYLRTTYRMLIVKDTQVNSTDYNVEWSEVMQQGSGSETDTLGSFNGIHSELNITNMGRFVILHDKYFDLDATNPQKTCPFVIPGSAVGSVRYNGPTANSLTDKGIYIICAAYTQGKSINGTNLGQVNIGTSNYHTRVCFVDA